MVLDLKPFPPHTAHLDSTASEINQYFKKKERKKKKKQKYSQKRLLAYIDWFRHTSHSIRSRLNIAPLHESDKKHFSQQHLRQLDVP